MFSESKVVGVRLILETAFSENLADPADDMSREYATEVISQCRQTYSDVEGYDGCTVSFQWVSWFVKTECFWIRKGLFKYNNWVSSPFYSPRENGQKTEAVLTVVLKSEMEVTRETIEQVRYTLGKLSCCTETGTGTFWTKHSSQSVLFS